MKTSKFWKEFYESNKRESYTVFDLINDVQADKFFEEILFMQEIKKMREMQKEFFMTRNTASLRESKKLEKKVDEWIAEYFNPSTKQKTLF